jgi:hypothetical protein
MSRHLVALRDGWRHADAVEFGVLAIFSLAVTAVVIGVLWRNASVRSPRAIVARLLQGEDPLCFRVRYPFGETWNPRGDPVWGRQRIVGPGRAIYTLESDNTLQLRFEPRRGTAQIYRVPLPRELVGPAPRQLQRRKRRLGGLLLGLNVAGAAGGLVIGYLLPEHGSAGTAGVGLLLGWLVAYGLQLLVVAGVAVREARGKAKRPPGRRP